MSDTSGISDEVNVDLVKGPDPDVWGEEHAAMPDPDEPYVYPEGVKGPDPEVWGEAHAAGLAQPPTET